MSPYLLGERPTSIGRIFLASAFQQHCTQLRGYSGREIAAALHGGGRPADRAWVRAAARSMGEALAHGRVRAWARPIGGGDPIRLRPGVWELDDYDRRFATSAIDPDRPFDADAEPTCWIFVDAVGCKDFTGGCSGDEAAAGGRRARLLRLGAGKPVEQPGKGAWSDRTAASGNQPDRLVRLAEVKHRTGLSRSTIYRRMGEGRFPRQVAMTGSIAAWREGELAEWLADPN